MCHMSCVMCEARRSISLSCYSLTNWTTPQMGHKKLFNLNTIESHTQSNTYNITSLARGERATKQAIKRAILLFNSCLSQSIN
jgi:hypothetical protein